MAVIENKWLVLAGLTAGTIIGAVKFSSNARALSGILGCPEKENQTKPERRRLATVIFLLNQIILLPLLFLAYYLSSLYMPGIIIIVAPRSNLWPSRTNRLQRPPGVWFFSKISTS
jgi:hypothetical protein